MRSAGASRLSISGSSLYRISTQIYGSPAKRPPSHSLPSIILTSTSGSPRVRTLICQSRAVLQIYLTLFEGIPYLSRQQQQKMRPSREAFFSPPAEPQKSVPITSINPKDQLFVDTVMYVSATFTY